MSVSTILTSKRTISAIVCSLSLAAMAATPVAVWDGDFGTSAKTGTDGKTYTLSLPSGAESWVQSDGTLKIGGGTQAANIAVTGGVQGEKLSILMEYSGATAQECAVPLYVNEGAYFGLRTKSGSSSLGLVGHFWTGNSGGNEYPSSGVVVTTMPESGYLLFVFPQGTISAYSGETRDALSGDSISGFSFSSKKLGNIGLGGCFTDGTSSGQTLNNFENLVIKRVAIFNSAITTDDVASYYFPSEVDTITVNADTTVSALNTQIAASSGSKIILSVADGVEINVDTAFEASVPVEVASSGTITLFAASQPDSSYFANVDFSGVQGGLLRSWLTTGVIGFNFNANGYRSDNTTTTVDACSDTALALEIGNWFKNASDVSGTLTDMFADGLSKLSWTSANLYAEQQNISSGTFIQGYLDDGSGGAKITLSNMPYETYDLIIYCSTDDSTKSFKAKTVNGTIYTWDATTGATVTTNNVDATWGLASAAAGKAVYGANTLRINGLSGPLSINGGTNSNGARGCISAIQIMPAGTSTAPTMTVGTTGQATAATWSDTTKWEAGRVPESGTAVINIAGDVTLTIDEAIELTAVTVTGEGTLTLATSNGATATMDSLSAPFEISFADDGVSIATLSASWRKYLYKTDSIASSTPPSTYTQGVGADDSPVSIAHNGGSVTLDGTAGAAYWLSQSNSGTSTLVTFSNATVNYSDGLSVGMANYTVEGASVINTTPRSTDNHSFYLSDGAAGRTASFILKDTSVVNVSGTSDVDSNRASILFGHWNGPSTFTIQDSAAFNAIAQVLVGKTGNNHTINLDGGTFTARGFKASAAASGTNTLNLNGGLAILGDVGITSYGSTSIGVNVTANSEIRASAATLPVSQPVTIASDATLSFTKASGVSAATVSLAGAVSGSGDISVGSGVTLNIGTNRPEGEISIDADGALAVVMSSKSDVPVLKVSSNPASVVLYDTDGTTVLSGADVIYDAEAGTITVHPPVNTWNVASDLAFDTAGNWSYGLPEPTQDTAIKVTGDAALTIAGTYAAATLTVSGNGVVEFSGEGSFTVGTLYLNGGATLAPNSKIVATSIVLDGGTVLRLKDRTESASISGAGAVETYGSVKFTADNTFTGGLTVNLESIARTTAQQGFGKNNYGQAIANLSRIVVLDGGSLDLANTKDACYAITIAGKGVIYDGVYLGALFNSGPEIGQNSRQTASLTLAADAMVRAEASTNGWGIVNSGHAASVLALNGHTLTVSGAGYFPIDNANTASGTQTTGTLIADGVTLGLVSTASNLTGVDVIAKGCATINLATAPSAIGSLTLKPTATGTTASNWSLPEGFVPALNTSNIDPSGLPVGDTLTLFTAPSGTELTSETITVNAGSRYETTISGNTVTATVKAGTPVNFIHYDFADGTGQAADTTYTHGTYNGATRKSTRNGKAMLVNSSNTPYHSSNSLGKSPFYTGEMTVTALVKAGEADNTILWNLGQASVGGIALLARNSTTFTLVSWDGNVDGSDVVSVTGVDVIGKWHLVTVVANASGTTLYVDNVSATVDAVLPSSINQCGQFGSIHGTAKNYNAVSGDGFLLDDWRVYDAALTAKEIKALKRELNPDPLFIRLR